MRVRIIFAATIVTVAIAGTSAHAACPDKRASCVLHEEGKALLLSGKFLDAATKFASSIAAEPTARAYLGYSQSVEGLGQLALAYDMMVVAQRLSLEEQRAYGSGDVEVSARAERIKYKLAELRGKVGFVWLRMPNLYVPRRVISVRRQGESDLQNPLSQWITMAPGRQLLIATLDDGSHVEIVTNLTAGAQQMVTIPIPGAAVPRPADRRPPLTPATTRPSMTHPSMTRPSMTRSSMRPPASVAASEPEQPAHLANTLIDLELVAVVPSHNNVNSGVGPGLGYTRRTGDHLAITSRIALLFREESQFGTPQFTSHDATELLVLVGAQTTPRRSFHGSLELGVNGFWRTAEFGNTTTITETYSRAYPVISFGGGIRLGRLHIDAGLMFAINSGAAIELPTRAVLTVGLDAVRR
ncbi:MAG: hypothetical protein AB7O24_18580 [Kofleriaceae bacterium]